MITINGTKTVKDKFQHLFLTVDVEGEDVKYVRTAPVGLEGEDLQKFVDAKEAEYVKCILADMENGRTGFTHPKSIGLKADLDKATTLDEVKAIVEKLL